MKWQHNIFTMPVNFRPTANIIIPVKVNGRGDFRAVLITRYGEVFLDHDGIIPEGFSAKSLSCLAATSYVTDLRALQDFVWAKELPPVSVKPPITGSWLIYMKYKQMPVRLCDSKEQAVKWMDQSSLLGLVFWPHDVSWFVIRERINRGMG